MTETKITPEVIKYIQDNHSTKTALEMSIECSVSRSTMSNALRKLNLKPFNSAIKLTHKVETIIKENHDKMSIKELSLELNISTSFLRRWIDSHSSILGIEPKNRNNLSFDNGKGFFDVDKFGRLYS